MQYHVCHETDVPRGEKRSYTVKNIPVVVVHSEHDEFYAIYGICPHQRSPLGEGTLVGLTEATQPGEEFAIVRKGEIIRCPWHGFGFDVKTGACLTEPDKFRVRTYPIKVDNHEIYLEI
ncbi:Rieske (2Fe-2S) protein [Dictyobacter formicarum]|uniref:Ferredoxin n=1 Tax=Dictyobacter formicarum TaxID=2778368 RepID=A0ABQ3VQP4_9CHLR|nr:Rieske (2Fe-2S) protein [Dictyobacter formicarum]GHO88465.1 ferredoxin [Dictyobacter formicarum]